MRERVSIGKIWGIVSPVVLYFLIQLLVLTIAMVLIVFWQIRMNVADYRSTSLHIYTTHILLLNLIAGMVAMPIFIWRYRRDMKQVGEEENHSDEKVGFLKYLLIIPFSIFSMLMANHLVTLLTFVMPSFMIKSYETTQEILFGGSVWIQIAATSVMAPIVEELVFRGLIYSRMKRFCYPWVAAIVSSLIFGIYHGNWIQAPYAFLMGLLAVYLYEQYRSILAPMLFHILANFLSVLLVYIATHFTNADAQMLGRQLSVGELLVAIWITGAVATAFGFLIHRFVRPFRITKKED